MNFPRRTLTLLRSFRIILRLGCFRHAAYAERYLGSRRLAAFALPHFLCVGETRGHRPNAFFDPIYFRSQAVGARYADYLVNRDLWVFATSVEFQVNEYLAHNSAHVATHECPLVHFLRFGFDAGLDPSAAFETRFCKEALFRDVPSAMEATYRALNGSRPAACLTAGALRLHQQRFVDSIAVYPLRLATGPKRRDLLLLQAGRHTSRSFSRDRPFDVLVNYYEAAFPWARDAEHVFHQRGTKCTAVAKLLEVHRDLLLAYDSVMLLDDDVSITQDQITALFDLRAAQSLAGC